MPQVLLPADAGGGNGGKQLTTAETIVFKDYGAEPTVLDIESYTLANENFRTVL
ncbi:MAG: hypothetical protein ACLRM8_08880 [Alistipes sp.]